MSNTPHGEEQDGWLAEYRAHTKEWWQAKTPEQQRVLLFRIIGTAIVLIIIIGGCGLLKEQSTKNAQRVGADAMPAIEMGTPQADEAGRSSMPSAGTGQPTGAPGQTPGGQTGSAMPGVGPQPTGQ